MHTAKKVVSVPKDGLEGLKENFAQDLSSGFVVFLLALPLSLGIAAASEFPPMMGVVTAIIGGLAATFFTGSKLAIKGPAAGLIVIVAGAVTEFGGGAEGWKYALGVLFVSGLVQILFGLMKWGKFVDIFPLSAVHGMLAAIGLIIIAKQVPVLLNVDAGLISGKGPIALLVSIPDFIVHANPTPALIGLVSLGIMFGWKAIKHPRLKMIPAPLLVLVFAIPAGMVMEIGNNSSTALLKVGSLADQIGLNISFGGVYWAGTFMKYVVLLALVGSLESLLTVKAIDLLDPWKRKSDPNRDLIAIGIANAGAALLGGLPMISEVARSSANVLQGGRTRWANFFHGLFLLLAALIAYPLLEMIPNAALAAILIAVGYNLAHPREFRYTYKIGAEQLAVFVTTIFFTLFEDLLIGIASGMLLEAVIHIFRGAALRDLFRVSIVQETNGNEYRVVLRSAAMFTNYLKLKEALHAIPGGGHLVLDCSDSCLVDHSVLENVHRFTEEYEHGGGRVSFVGLDGLQPSSAHPLAARYRSRKQGAAVDAPISTRTTVPSFSETAVLHDLKHYLPAQAALKDFVHHNSLHAFQDQAFFEAIFAAAKIFGIQTTFNLNEYRKLYRQGRIGEAIVDRVIARRFGSAEVQVWKDKMLTAVYTHDYTPRVGKLRAEWKNRAQFDMDNRVQPLLFRIISSYLDQGIALIHFPFEDKGLLEAVRTLERNAYTSFFRSARVKAWLLSGDTRMEDLLEVLVGDQAYYRQYLLDQQFAHKGWSGIIHAIEENPGTLLYRKEISLKDFILLELLLEIDVLDRAFGKKWDPLAKNIGFAPEDYFSPVPLGEREQVIRLWQEAFEWDYYDEVLGALAHVSPQRGSGKAAKPAFQGIFCIDDREDSIRRHVEHVAPDSETFGAPGFFGVAMYFQPFGSKFYEKNCPVPVTPRHLIRELNREPQRKTGILHPQHKHSHTSLRGLMFAFSLGLTTGFRMLFDLFRPRVRPDMADSFSHMDINGALHIECTDPQDQVDGLQLGYTVEEMADMVFNLLKGIGLTAEFADIVYVVAHGSSSANNPHHGAYDCGACSGRPGSPNARVFAFMANHAKVRLILETRGLLIPDTTAFVAAMHDTASDVIRYYDEDTLSSDHQNQHREYALLIEHALDLNARERARRFASINLRQDIKAVRKAIQARSRSYFEPRPELGHGTNALCYVGARETMKNLFLDRRAFLQSYDYQADPEGVILAQVMAPLPVVCGGINLEYYFSRMDNEKMGAGTKLSHNVAGLIGVINSADGDLRPGLPLQMIENHDPMRLLMIVEHSPEVVLRVIRASEAMYEWFDLGWIHLVVVSPLDGHLYHFCNGNFEHYQPLKAAQEIHDFQDLIPRLPRMRTNNILDATKENLPVHVFNPKR
ncbi:MAG: Na-translocating system protein MpsB [Saprospiraceae bacterium]|nr:Na-translocating system protein MpsB [Saprospiraceae bacterium]